MFFSRIHLRKAILFLLLFAGLAGCRYGDLKSMKPPGSVFKPGGIDRLAARSILSAKTPFSSIAPTLSPAPVMVVTAAQSAASGAESADQPEQIVSELASKFVPEEAETGIQVEPPSTDLSPMLVLPEPLSSITLSLPELLPLPAPTLPEPAPSLTPTASETALAPEQASLDVSYGFYGIDFNNNQRVEIKIYPNDNRVNRGKPVKISFIPEGRCKFGDKHGCVYAYKPTYAGNVIIITVHSGVGGEAQRLRSAIEGTRLNSAGYSLERTMENIQSLANARVTISQGDREIDTAQVGAVTRIPAQALPRYLNLEMAEILPFAASLEPALGVWALPEQPVIVLETCGWKMPGEAGSARASDTTGSIYLTVIH